MRIKQASFLILLVVTALLATGCFGRRSTERSFERAIEQQTGGQANVDIDRDGEQIKIETPEGTFQAGGNVVLPANVPSYPGSQAVGKIETTTPEGKIGNMYSLTSNDSPEKISAFYKDYYTSNGWSLVGEINYGANRTLSFKKGEDEEVVITAAGDTEGSTAISIVITNQQ